MSEQAYAIQVANRVLDNTSLDPDGDLCVLARQLLRLHERLGAPKLVSPAKDEDFEAQRRLAEESEARD